MIERDANGLPQRIYLDTGLALPEPVVEPMVTCWSCGRSVRVIGTYTIVGTADRVCFTCDGDVKRTGQRQIASLLNAANGDGDRQKALDNLIEQHKKGGS